MVEAIHADQPLTVIVPHPTFGLAAGYPGEVRPETYPGRDHLSVGSAGRTEARRSLTGSPTSEAIARSDLMKVPLQAQPGQRFENVVLEIYSLS